LEAVISRPATSGGPSDQEIMTRVANGDGAAFGTLVERYEDRLYNTIFRLVGSAEDARDLLQDTFVKAYENLDGFRGGSSLYTWLFRIAVNTSLSFRRKRKPIHATASQTSEDDPPPSDGWADPAAPDPSDPVIATETEAIVQQALDGLEEEYRTVVVLRDIQHCDYREMAEILDIPPGTVKSRLHRARLMLRDKLKPLLNR
jgi:RNA polymerase sigma-70 factor (ECF subfamily)